MATKSNNPPIKTIEITNFGGRLTRIINGDLNSGFANFQNSWGYDPFSKPGNLTWLEQPTNITGPITDLILATIPNSENGSLFIYMLGSQGTLYKIQPNSISNANVDSVVGVLGSVLGSGQTYNYGASMQLFNYRATTSQQAASTIGRLYISGDNGINEINTDGTGQASVAGASGGYVENIYKPTAQFQGNLVFGNGNNIGLIGSTNTITSPQLNPASIYGQLQPPLPPNTYITDLDVSPDGNYLLISTSTSLNEQPTNYGNATGGSLQQTNTAGGNLYFWNGSDEAATASNYIGNFGIISLQSYLQNNMMFINDMFGSSINNGTEKVLTLNGNKSPFPNGTAVNGNFLTWITTESPDGETMVASLYYYGNLDNENQPGLWRVMRYFTQLAGINQQGFIAQTPTNTVINSDVYGINPSGSSILSIGYGKHYLSVMDINSSTVKYTLQRFTIINTGTTTVQFGTYQTQTQLFSKKISVKQIRVYTEPTAAGNGFEITLIGSNGKAINGTLGKGFFEYQFATGTDITQLEGSLDRIDFNPIMVDTYALGLQITQIGESNFTIHKIEVDYTESGK